MSQNPTAAPRVPALVVRGSQSETRTDALVGEEPLQIRAAGPRQEPVDVAITMRTPGSEHELAIGFLVAEGLVEPAQVAAATFEFGDPATDSQPHNQVTVQLPVALQLEAVAHRHFVATASCGICGRASIDELVARVQRLPDGPLISRAVIVSLPDAMRAAQQLFEETGGIHAAALFTSAGQLVALREDIGRHNAVDKLIGSLALAGALPAHESILLVSGRVSFEIVQKAAAAGITVLCAVSAASDLAVSTAERVGMTVVGFLRGNGFNVYSRSERIDLAAGPTSDVREATAIVLAGGRSSRFGDEKMAADLNGVPLLHHAVRAATSVCEQVLVVGSPHGLPVPLPSGLDRPPQTVLDTDPFGGPLVALAHALTFAEHDRVLLIAGDMPDLQVPVLARLLSWAERNEGACIVVGDRVEPFPMGLDRAVAATRSAELVAVGERSLRRLVSGLDMEPITEPELRAIDPEARSLRDVDWPQDLAGVG